MRLINIDFFRLKYEGVFSKKIYKTDPLNSIMLAKRVCWDHYNFPAAPFALHRPRPTEPNYN